mmetsp:Transcript_17354/g.39748  ORF Transcript_17354/g.39748 Transcript_17354/m.39748 type:complete len:340 (-) Transcript_17354:285-1304(-)
MNRSAFVAFIHTFFSEKKEIASLVLHSTNSTPTTGPTHTLILTRHGDSIWNGKHVGCKETFTGWTDVPLSPLGEKEAIRTGEILADLTREVEIDALFTSTLSRAKMTAHYVWWAYNENLEEQYRREKHYQYYNRPGNMPQQNSMQYQGPAQWLADYRLNERHYGSLQGLVKVEAERGDFGHSADEVYKWRRSWHAKPPILDDDDPRRLEERRRFGPICGLENIPRGESLNCVAKNRIRPFVEEKLTPLLEEAARRKPGDEGGTALIVAHANSLRALIGVICKADQNETAAAFSKLEAMKIPTASPLVLQFRLVEKQFTPVDSIGEGSNPLPVYPIQYLF